MTKNPPTNAAPHERKPGISYFLATSGGVGYLTPGSGTWGSVVGVGLSILLAWFQAARLSPGTAVFQTKHFWTAGWAPSLASYVLMLVISAVGVYAATRVERHSGKHDPQIVVIDEVSGQLIALSLPFVVLNWKSWVLGFILFRVLDVWKPFPARQAESLPGGWGIMADDWMAGIYAALGLWIVQTLGWLR